jgi:TP901 family phage tail tape measure protein
MNIVVRVIANRAQAVFARLRGEISSVNAQAMASNRIDPMGRRHLTSLMKFGNQLQWTGRMIQYNFTLPLALAAGAATKWSLENQKAFVHVQKVYGDTGDAAAQFRKENSKLTQQMAENKAARIFAGELDALRESFIAISNHYGVAQKEVLEVAGAWAAAGASGLNLAKSVDATMQAIIIGDMQAAQATKALISIQAQYNLNSEELMDTLAALNSVENATGASMQDLIVAYEKSAGVARTAGVSTRELAAYVAALVPASGSAATAGNALKTIFSRLVSPTKETVQVLNEMGLSMDDLDWKSATVSEQLQIMSDKFQGLSDKQKNVVATVAASRWQVNRFDILMKELNSDLGFYAKAMSSADDAGENFRRMQKELNTVLESDPRRLQRMWVMLQNASAEVIQPLIPYIIYLAQVVASAVTAFSNLNPELQKLVLFGLVFLALIGPVVKYIGALGTLFGVVGFALRHVVSGLFGMLGVVTKLGTPFKMLGTIAMGAIGAISSGVSLMFAGVLSLFTGGFGRVLSYTATFWKIQIGIWRAGFTILLLRAKIFHLSWLGFWAVTTATTTTRWAAMWVAMKVITVAALNFQVGILGKFRAMWAKAWALTAIVTTNIWGRMAVMIGLLTRNLLRTVAALMLRIVPVLLGPWGIAIAAIVGILYAFRTQITQIWRNIIDYFDGTDLGGMFVALGNTILGVFRRLPQGVQDAMIAVVTVVRDAALAVYNWFSYLNPFARHSPSLVDNVDRGVDRINAKFQQLGKVKGVISSVYAEIKRFSNLTKNLNLNASQLEVKEDRKAIRKAGGGGDALKSYNKLQGMLRVLNPLLAQTEARLNAQQRVVDRWQRKLDEANDALDRQQEKLQKLQERLQKWQDKLDEANSRLDYFSSAPLEGMRAMEDQIFANTMAQNRLRYEMMQMEKVTGTFEDLQAKMESINGLQEIMRGTQDNLRAAGAGSEILGQYDAEIAKLEEQKGTYTETFDKLNDMRLELERLQRQAEELDLVKALKFDELQYQIDRTADRTKELSFEEIIAGIKTAQGDIDKYTEKVTEAAAAVRAQEDVVKEAERTRDRIQERLDAEQAALDRIREKYDGIRDAIDAIKNAISEVVANAEKMNAELDKNKDKAAAAKKKKDSAGAEGYISPGLQNFMDAAGANYPDPGGSGMPPRTDWSSQAKDIEDWTAKLSERTADMFADINPFATLKTKAIAAWDWIVNKAKVGRDKIVGFFSTIFDDVDFGSGTGKISDFFEPILEFVTEVGKSIGNLLGAAWDLLGPDIKKIAKGIWNGFKDIWERVGPELEKFKDLWGPIGDAIENAWRDIKPVLALLAGAILGVIEVGLQIVSELIDPVFDLLGDLITGIIKVVRGVIEIIAGLFNGDLPMILDGVKDLFSGLWDIIWGIFKFGVRLVWNVVEGFVQGIVDFFVWCWKQIEPMVSGWWDGIKDAWKNIKDNVERWWTDHVTDPIKDKVSSWWDKFTGWLGEWWGNIKAGWGITKDAVKTWWTDHVTDPIKDKVSGWWDKFTGWLGEWWGNIKAGWGITKEAVKTWWGDHVTEPIKEKVSSWWTNFTTWLGEWWGNIKTGWAITKEAVKTWWGEHVTDPIKDKVSGWWTNFTTWLGEWWGNIKTAWDNLTGENGVKAWWTKHVTDPIFDKVTGVWTDIKNWFVQNKNVLVSAIRPVVNSVIGAVNTIIGGLNKVSDVLPGNLWHISEIPKLEADAAGTQELGMMTRRANRGFKTAGARAIVGEGKANHPEFVIPTDPTHRNRAKSLLAMAAQKLGMADAAASVRNSTMRDGHGIPMFGLGGWLSEAWDDTKNLGKKIANLPKQVISSIMNKILDGAGNMINKIGYQPVESPPEFGIQKLRDWVADFDDAIGKKLDSMVPAGGSVPVADPSSPGAQQYWGGGLFTRRFVAHMERAEELAKSGITVYQGGFRPPSSYSGTSHQGDALDMQVNYAILRSLRAVGIASGDRTGLGDWKAHIHAIPGPSAGSAAGSAVWQWQDYMARGGASQSPTSPWGLKAGAIIRKRTGGTMVTVAEGAHDEAIIPLTNDLKSGFGKTEINFYGATLEFPNIKTADDADEFIRNIQNLARD